MNNDKKYQSLIVPQITWEALTDSYGECIAIPLEPGFGVTFGNALRRIMLGGIEGSAVTSVIFKGVNNEFSVLPGVIDDTLQIILNIKQLIIKNTKGISGKMTLKISEEGPVLASAIKTDDHLEILNKDLVLANLAKDGDLEIEFFVECGRGYKLANWPVDKALQEDDRIYIDAAFSPVCQISFDVEKTRVGSEIDYDKLILRIETNGTIDPKEVLNYAASIMKNQTQVFLDSNEINFVVYHSSKHKSGNVNHEVTTQKEEDKSILLINGIQADLLLKPIAILGLPSRVQNALFSANVERVIDLVNLTESDISEIKNFGKKSNDDLMQIMREYGLSFDMKINEKDVMELVEKYETSNT